MSNISPQAQKLIGQYQEWFLSLQKKKEASTIHVDEVASRVAAFYEKIRGVIDWREEHLLRRGAIERILKRRLFLRIGQKVEALPFIQELIRAGHFPNNEIEESKVDVVQAALDKYVYIVENSPKPEKERSRMALQDWLATIAACEVEEILDPPRKERIIIDYMTALMIERIQLKNGLSEEEKNTQIFIAVQRALFKLDPPMITYHLLKRQFPKWMTYSAADTQNGLGEITRNIYAIWHDTEKKLRYPMGEKFYRVCERFDSPYLILGDVLSQDPMVAREKLGNPEVMENDIRYFYQLRLAQEKGKVKRAAFYSTLSIFATKMLLAYVLEYMIIDNRILHSPPSLLTLGINVTIPPLLMLLIILSIKPPRKENIGKIIIETMKITYDSKEKDVYPIKTTPKKGFIASGLIFIFYSATFIGELIVLWWALGLIKFSWPSRVIFILFLSLILFAGTKIKERAKELSVEQESGGFLGFVFDWASLPFIQLGKWMSGQWAKYNLFLVILITLVDLPFQVFVQFIEHWRSFIKEKREEIH